MTAPVASESPSASPNSPNSQDPTTVLKADRSVGFPKSKEAPVAAATPRPVTTVAPLGAPTPKRPKGRMFISLVILTICSVTAMSLYNEFVRFQGYGLIDGKVVKLSAPWAGIVKTLHVKNGEYVTQGQLLATLENTELRLRLGKLQDEARLARAALATRLAELKASERDQSERATRVYVDYFDLLGRFYVEQSRLDELRNYYERVVPLGEKNAVAESEVVKARYALEGQQKRVDELSTAVDQMKSGLESAQLAADEEGLLSVEQARVETALLEWGRLSDYQRLGEIRAPVSGRVVERHPYTGEFVSPSTVIMEVLEEGSIEAVLYVPQRRAREFEIGKSTQLNLPPYRENLEFTVDRVGDQMVPAPPSLKRYYRASERLVPVYASPTHGHLRDTQGDFSMWLGAEVRLPRFRKLEL